MKPQINIECNAPRLLRQKINYVSQAPPMSLSTPASKLFIAFPLINVKNHQHIVNYQFNLIAICLVWLVDWLNSGAPPLMIGHPLFKVEKFHRQNIVFIYTR